MSDDAGNTPGHHPGQAQGGVWDRQRLLDRYYGDMETVIELCRAMREDIPAKLAGLHAAADAGDLEALARVAHSIKGVCGTMASEPCRLIALDLEMAARGGDITAVLDALPKLLEILERLLDELPG